MIDNVNRRIRVGDKIYRVFWQPIDGEPIWSFIEYIIEDMWYSDNCYVILRDTKCGLRCAIMMNHEELLDWYYSEEEAQAAVKRESSIPRSYAWGNSAPRSDKSTWEYAHCEPNFNDCANVSTEKESVENISKELIQKEHFLVRLYKALKSGDLKL